MGLGIRKHTTPWDNDNWGRGFKESPQAPLVSDAALAQFVSTINTSQFAVWKYILTSSNHEVVALSKCNVSYNDIVSYNEIVSYNRFAPKEHLHPTGMMFVRTYVRTHVHTSRWKILFTPYLVVELSPSAEIWCVCVCMCVYVTSINDGTQILTFLGIHNNRDFLNSRFFCGNLIILNPELHWFLFPDRLQLLHSFPKLCTLHWVKRNISVRYPQRYLCLGCLCSGW